MQAVHPPQSNTLMVFFDIFVSPQSVFKKLTHIKALSWVALLALCSLIFLSEYMFYQGMSPEWLVSQQMLQIGDQLQPAEQEMVAQMLMQSAGNTGLLSGIFASISQVVMVVLLAIYFVIIGKINHSGETITLGGWFNFSTWVAMPILIQTIGFIILFLTASSPDLPITLAQYASVNQLFLDLPQTHALYTWASSLSVFYLWSILIAAFGLKQLCSIDFPKALLLSALPFVLVFGVWFLIA